MRDRKKAPALQPFEEIRLPEPEIVQLENGIPVYLVEMGTQDVIKLELVFKAGRPFEHKPLISRATASMLREGTSQYTAAQIAETVDYFGGSLTVPYHMDTSNVALFCLTKYLEELLPVMESVVCSPVFPTEELELFKKNSAQRLQIELSKTDVVAYRTITECIFGADHPYGYNSFPESYPKIERADLIKHHKETFVAGNCFILVSGKLPANIVALLNSSFGRKIPAGDKQPYMPSVSDKLPRKIKIEHPDALQTAVRLGKILFNRGHEDYYGMYMVNTLIGGYFGSRLMSNIREDKGYTYNIYSSLDTLMYNGYFNIGTEVGNEFVEATLKEIYKELDSFCNTLVPVQEMEMARNYILGNLLTMLDGPFQVSELIKSHIMDGLPFSSFEKLASYIQQITREEVMELAGKYLNPDSFWEVLVGR